MIQAGDTYSWVPASNEGASGVVEIRRERGRLTVHGRVIYINERHRYFTVEADAHGISCARASSLKMMEA